MSDDGRRTPREQVPPDTMVPLVDTPGQLYPPARDQSRPHHSSNQDLRSDRRSGSYRTSEAPAPTTVVMSQPTPACPGASARYRHQPVMIVCQYCQATVTTSVEDVRGNLQYILCAMMCCYGCWLGCCLLPLYVNDLKDVQHTCPNCNKFVGKFKHIG